jgi:hypothetical protein
VVCGHCLFGESNQLTVAADGVSTPLLNRGVPKITSSNLNIGETK